MKEHKDSMKYGIICVNDMDRGVVRVDDTIDHRRLLQ